jgi:hypothetical protein
VHFFYGRQVTVNVTGKQQQQKFTRESRSQSLADAHMRMAASAARLQSFGFLKSFFFP